MLKRSVDFVHFILRAMVSKPLTSSILNKGLTPNDHLKKDTLMDSRVNPSTHATIDIILKT